MHLLVVYMKVVPLLLPERQDTFVKTGNEAGAFYDSIAYNFGQYNSNHP